MKLTFKLTASVLIIVITLLTITSIFYIEKERKFLVDLQNKKAKAIANTISTSIVDALLLRDYPIINSVLENTRNSYSEVAFLKVHVDENIILKVENKNLPLINIFEFKSEVTIDDDVIGVVEIAISNLENEKIIDQHIQYFLLITVLIAICLIILFIFVVKFLLIDKITYLSNITQEINIDNLDELQVTMKSNDELGSLGSHINDMIKQLDQEIKENNQKEYRLAEQAKSAALGEMIGNIAHQWRQPLSVISTDAGIMQLKHSMNKLDDEQFKKHTDAIIDNTQYLSQTIDTFRNFLKSSKEYKEIVVQDEIEQSKKIIGAVLKSKDIHLQEDINYDQEIIINGVENELTQVLINIINNAKDILVEKEIEDRWIKMVLISENNLLTITIEDNGGGIPDNILPHIYEPYFSTKDELNGTGLGLNMSYRIIVESLKGNLYVKNTQNGAKFYIEIPLNPS